MAGLFAPKVPKASAPVQAPTPDDDQIDAVRRRRAELARAQSGLESTKLTTGRREVLG